MLPPIPLRKTPCACFPFPSPCCWAAPTPPALAAQPATPAATAVPGSEQIVSKTAANGLKIIVWPDHDIPSANYTFYRVGSRNEHVGITGLAHFFEHMMFNGTSRRAQGEFDRTMEAAGGDNNASTSNDLTASTPTGSRPRRWRQSSISKATAWRIWPSCHR